MTLVRRTKTPPMRTYPGNSPEAAARILAIALVADGHYSLVELQALDTLAASQRLGLPAQALKEVIADFCRDLLQMAGGEWTGSHRMDAACRLRLLNEVTDPDLRQLIVELAQAVVEADGHLTDGEAQLMDTLSRLWRQPASAPGPQRTPR